MQKISSRAIMHTFGQKRNELFLFLGRHQDIQQSNGELFFLLLGRHQDIEQSNGKLVTPLLRAALSGKEQLTAGDRKNKQKISRTCGAAADHEEPGRRRREAADEGAERVVALVPVVRRAALLHVPRVPVLRLPVAESPASAVPAAALLGPVVAHRRRRRRHRRRVEGWGGDGALEEQE